MLDIPDNAQSMREIAHKRNNENTKERARRYLKEIYKEANQGKFYINSI